MLIKALKNTDFQHPSHQSHGIERTNTMIFLNQSDIFSISRAHVQSAVEDAYRVLVSENFNMPDRIHVHDRGNTLLLMPCFSEKYFATKLVSVFPKAWQHQMPVVNGMLVLCDNTTGRPLSVMDGAAITAQRTGAVGGLAVKYLSRDDLQTAGIFGAGIQGCFQARYLLSNRAINTLYIHDHKPELADKMARMIENEFAGVSCRVEQDPETVIRSSELVICATTSPTPVFELEDLQTGPAIYIGIGSFQPDMQEFPDAVTRMAEKVYVDTAFAVEESGDLKKPIEKGLLPQDKIELFASIVDAGQPVTGKPVFFKSVGMALFDLTVAAMVYEAAREQGLGQSLKQD
ncbi:MAG: ornithine cyclodeaminase family protein [Desulfobacteraceae bacterium]|nr:MAG: ornithine cyclodeaminase family protein [Desulfobacteraceae bacterium]